MWGGKGGSQPSCGSPRHTTRGSRYQVVPISSRGRRGEFPLNQNAHLLHLPLVPLVGPRDVVCERLRPREVVVAAGRRDDVALAGDLAGEPRDGAGDWGRFTSGRASNQYLKTSLLAAFYRGWYVIEW